MNAFQRSPLRLAIVCAVAAYGMISPGSRSAAQDASPRNEAQGEHSMLTFQLCTRDPQTSEPTTRTESVDPAKVAVVIVDPWNYHWCMTACERVNAMVPRWNRALECARRMGMPVVWAPSDVVGAYAGYPQRERALALPLVPVPKPAEGEQLQARFTAPVGGCMCGPGARCICNYSEDAMNPALYIAPEDTIISSTEEIYALLSRRAITHVIYMGLHTNMCLYGKPGALRYMADAGLKCLLARDINDAFTSYDPHSGFTPDQGTSQTDDDLERAGIPTINVVETFRRAGLWNDAWTVETVRIVPWGKPDRPYLFRGGVLVTLTAPWLDNVEIRYTLDGGAPAPNSALYERPIRLRDTSSLRAAAFRGGKPVSIETDAFYVRLPLHPLKPQVYLDKLESRLDPYAGIGAVHASFFSIPKTNESFEGKPLRVRGHVYARGLGTCAPSNVRFDLRPEFARFVALAGIDDNMLDAFNGSGKARYPSVVFRVFIDGEMAAESAVMRISQEPWRFDVPIPEGARVLSLAAMDAGTHHPLDLANWVDAGFVLKDGVTVPEAEEPVDDAEWETAEVPSYWDRGPGAKHEGYDGVAWYRCFVRVPESWAGRELRLHVEHVDNHHVAYFNGVAVGEGDYNFEPFVRHAIEAQRVRPGAWNLVALRVEDWGGAGGFSHEAPVLYSDSEAMELRGPWQFHIGDNSAWARWAADEEPPDTARFSKTAPASTVLRQKPVAE